MADDLEPVQRALRDLGKSLKSLERDPDPEDVHKLRTSARRVEAIAAALPEVEGKKSRRLVKAIEPLRKAAGKVRDMDVLTANLRRLAKDTPGDSLNRLVDHLRFVRESEAGDLRHTLDRKRGAARHNLKQYARKVESEWPANGAASTSNGATPTSASTSVPGPAGQTIHAKNGHHRNGTNPAAKHLARELAEWPALNEHNIHEFRLRIKELRYVLQLDAKADEDFVGALGSVQRRIGEWHDWEQLAEIAHEFLNPTQDHELLRRIDETMQKKLKRALGAANALRRQFLRSAVLHIPGC
jgi:CHAD domain-containing protein